MTKEEIIKFKEDAINDGWEIEPIYENESIETAFRLTKEGYDISIILRDNYKSVAIWGPDGLQIPPQQKYDMDYLRKALTCCPICGAESVKTYRYSFAGRCCKKCLPEMQRKFEYPGWTK